MARLFLARSGSVPVSTLPSPPTPLIGRTDERRELGTLLRDPEVRLITLVGPPGVGKSRLGLQVAADGAEAFDDGVHFVALGSLTDPEPLIPAVASAIGLSTERADPRALLQAHLRDRHLLLVLDDFESVLGAAPDVAELLQSAPRLTALVTSRVALRLQGEHEYPVAPLTVPALDRLPDPDRLAEAPVVALFLERARAVRPGFELTRANAPVVARICARLDGIPLAIELAAVRMKVLGPQALLARLSDRLGLLGKGAQDRPPRRKTLRAALEWSYELLDPEERRLLRALGVFAGGCTLDAVASVCAEDDDALLDRLETLVDHSLLQASVASTGESRFAMLQTTREFALERLRRDEDDGGRAFRRRHALYYRSVAERLEGADTGRESAEWLDRLSAERDNFRAALTWAVETRDGDVGVSLAAVLWRFWHQTGHLTDGRKWLDGVLALPGPESPARAEALCGAGVLARFQGEVERARDRLTEAEALWRRLGDTRGLAETLHYLGMAERYAGDVDAARTHLDEALSHWRRLDDPAGLARALSMRAGLANQEDDPETAAALRRESLDLWRALGDRDGIGRALLGLGEVARRRRDHDEAREHYRRALALFRELGDRYHQAAALHNLGHVERRRGDLDRALEHLLDGLRYFDELGHQFGRATSVVGIAGILLDRGEARTAARLLGAADRWREELGITTPAADRAEWDETRASALEALDDAEFARLAAAGAALETAQLLRLARTAASEGEAGAGADRASEADADARSERRAAAASSPETTGEAQATAEITDREMDVLELLAEGLTYAEIGERLFISPRTVDAHLRSIYSKLRVHSRHAATRAAERRGLL